MFVVSAVGKLFIPSPKQKSRVEDHRKKPVIRVSFELPAIIALVRLVEFHPVVFLRGRPIGSYSIGSARSAASAASPAKLMSNPMEIGLPVRILALSTRSNWRIVAFPSAFWIWASSLLFGIVPWCRRQ